MEGDDLSSYKLFEAKLGLQKRLSQNSLKPRAKKMEREEKKSGAKERSKPIEIGVDSDDNEPIGSFFKLKRPRNPKKGKAFMDKVEARGEKLGAEDDDFGGMDDTLASFRKKLKGPKKDIGSVSGRPSEDTMEKGCNENDDLLDVAMDKGVQTKHKERVKRTKINVERLRTAVEDDLEALGSLGVSLADDKEEALLPGEDSSHSADEKLENSLSAFFQKKQPVFTRMSQSNSSLQQNKNRAQSLEDGLRPTAEVVLGFSKSVAGRTLRSVSASNVVCKDTKAEDSSYVVASLNPLDFALEQSKKVKNQRLDNGFFHASNCVEGNSDTAKGPCSIPAVMGESMRSNDKRHGRSSNIIPEVQALTSPPSVPQYGGIEDECMVDPCVSNVKEELMVDPFGSRVICDGNCSASGQKDGLETETLKNGFKLYPMGKASTLVQDVVALPNTSSASVQIEDSHGFDNDNSNRDFRDALDQQSRDVSTVCVSNAEPYISFSSSRKEIPAPSFKKELLKKSFRNPSLFSNHSPHHLKMDEIAKTENWLDFDQCPKVSQHAQPHLSDSAFVSHKIEETFSDCDNPNSHNEEPNLASFSPQKENPAISDGRLFPMEPDEVSKSGFSSQMNHHGSSLELYAKPNESSAFIQKCSSVLHLNQHSDNATKETCVPSHDHLSIIEEANGASPPSITAEENESYPEDALSVPDSEIKDAKFSAVQRAARKAKKRRLGDMAYEGDADWEILINEQQFLEIDQVGDSERSFRTREKSDSSSISITEAENGGTAAVLVGLKARAAGPVEKIKFKEVLKRKGGLQEYLECRNQILSLWSKDVSRILPLADCGVTNTPSEDESSRASLIRQIYTFLDQSGYINVGIASEKEKAELSAKDNCNFFKENNFEENPGASVTDLEDGVSFILGQAKSFETSLEAKDEVTIVDENLASKATKSRELVTPMILELPYGMECEECPAVGTQQTGTIDAKSSNGLVNMDVLSTDLSCTILDSKTAPVITPELRNDLQSVQSSSYDDTMGSHNLQHNCEVKRKIIVIGAGPAGLTAARHLQRQGLSVTVLEARTRIGGRVYTDRSSLSVPVDLGASIITGVEADVATERRPDPSSLICAQLGLELAVLNSDCPLYDIVTGEKVPTALDEALEAEYNSLLDDMLLLVAQKGEHAMKMSLEDGLEYALESRRVAQSKTDIDETQLENAEDTIYDSKTSGVDGEVPERSSKQEILSPLERRVMDWHFANLEYGCAALLNQVSLPYWNQDDVYGGFGGAHCMIKGGYSNVVESLREGLLIHLNHVVTDISYGTKDVEASESQCNKVKVTTSNGSTFLGDAVLITVPLGCLKAETIKFSPPLPQWKHSSIQKLGFGVLNKVVLEFPDVFWDDSVDYFGATAEETDRRGHCFMFWNIRKTVGAPVLIALVVGKAAIDGQSMSSSDHVSHALRVLRKLFGEALVPDPVASVVTDWGRDPFSYGAYSYVAIGSSGEDYDLLGRPVENCLFFAGEATCKEHPDTVGGAMMSGLREAVRIIDILSTGNDYTAEVEAMETAQRHSESERDEVWDITKRLEAIELSNVLYKNSLDRARILTREALLQDMFFSAKTTAGRLHLAKELLNLPVETLKSFAGNRKGLTTLNSWILDSMGKDGTQLLRHCVRILVLVSTDLLAVRLSGIGKTVKEKVCVHTSRDIRAIASQLVSVWLEVFRREKASNGRLKLSRQASAVDYSKRKSLSIPASGKPPLRTNHGALENKGSLQILASTGNHTNTNKVNGKLETVRDSKLESRSHASLGRLNAEVEGNSNIVMSEEEQAALAAAEAACAAARAAAKAYASSEAKCNTMLQLPKIPSFHKFARREQYAHMEEYDLRRKWSGGVFGRQDCISEIDSRNCRVRDWSVDFSAACSNLDNSRISVDNLSQRSHSNEIACHMSLREQSGESAAVDSSLFTKAWVDTAGSVGIKDYHAIERWQSQAAAADSDFFHQSMNIKDEEDSNISSKAPTWKHDGRANESSVSQRTLKKEPLKNHSRGADRIKQAVVDYVASLLMPLYKARKIDREGYKSIMKKSATKVMEQATDAEKAMAVSEFLDFKRKNKIRSFVDKLIERHMAMKPAD